jgi:hypothetical protein
MLALGAAVAVIYAVGECIYFSHLSGHRQARRSKNKLSSISVENSTHNTEDTGSSTPVLPGGTC